MSSLRFDRLDKTDRLQTNRADHFLALAWRAACPISRPFRGLARGGPSRPRRGKPGSDRRNIMIWALESGDVYIQVIDICINLVKNGDLKALSFLKKTGYKIDSTDKEILKQAGRNTNNSMLCDGSQNHAINR